MPNAIFNPKQIEISSCKIACGLEKGTGFKVSENLIVTARHVVMENIDDSTSIEISFEGLKHNIPGILIAQDEVLDIAIIRIDEIVNSGEFIPLSLNAIRYNDNWETFGYPYAKGMGGGRFSGQVIKINNYLPYDIELFSENIDENFDYSGLSGAPLVINGQGAGIIVWSIIRGLGAISVQKIIDLLRSVDVPVTDDDTELPSDFLEELNSSVPNYNVLDDLDLKVTKGGKYYLLHGSPGCGKSTICGYYQPQGGAAEILGRYFINIPGDSAPIAFKASKNTFIQWVEDLISKILVGMITPKENHSIEYRIQRLALALDELNKNYLSKGSFAIIVLDGLDDIGRYGNNSIGDFLSILPEKLPSNIAILLSCTSKEILPINIRAYVTDSEEILVTPLSMDESQTLILGELESAKFKLSSSQVYLIAQRTEGHPLYLKYLLANIISTKPIDIESYIQSIPVIGGNISTYYEKLWSSQITIDSDKYWIILTVSQLRQSAKRTDLVMMLPELARYAFNIKLTEVKHLFKSENDISLYHSSFKLFIESKADVDLRPVHDNITAFCRATPKNSYSIANIIFHIVSSSTPHESIGECTQTWADRCALIHSEPDLVISDIQTVETICIRKSDFAELIRIKLLLQRIRFRYDNVFAENAIDIADALVDVGNAKAAIKYILRGDLLLVSQTDAIYFLQKLFESGSFHEAQMLLNAIQVRFNTRWEQDLNKGVINFGPVVTYLEAITLSINKDFLHAVNKFNRWMIILKKIQTQENADLKDVESIKGLREYLSAWHLAYSIYRFKLYPGLEQIRALTTEDYNSEWAQHLAQAYVCYFQFVQNGSIEQEKEVNRKLINDIEFLIDNYGYREKDVSVLLMALLEDSNRFDIVEDLIFKLEKTTKDFSIRNSNGVDAAIDTINSYLNEKLYEAYIESKSNFPIIKDIHKNYWESYFESLFDGIGWITGRAYRLKAENNPEKISELIKFSWQIIDKINFSFADRINWDRSYLIPETIIPYLFQKIVVFYLEFAPDQIKIFIQKILKRSNDQLGIYTEGYRRSLFTILNLLSKKIEYADDIFPLLNQLEVHISSGVQNRVERTPLLLQLVGLYGKIGQNEKANTVYQRMLDSSMGPNWYKEDQFALINSALVKVNSPKSSSIYKYFAAQLDYASGEMTFQRYIQQEKHSFINSLVEAGDLYVAIEYFKFQLLPAPEIILKNAQDTKIDTPKIGDGYELGANRIIEASAIVDLLDPLNAHPFLVLALTNIFVVNDDTSRYIQNYASIQASAINKLHSQSLGQLQFAIARVVKRILKSDFASYQLDYLKLLKDHLLVANYTLLKENAIHEGIDAAIFERIERKEPQKPKQPSTRSNNDNFSFIPGVGNMKNFDSIRVARDQCIKKLELGRRNEALDVIRGLFKLLSDGESNIWLGKNLTTDLGDLFEMIGQVFTIDEALILFNEYISVHSTKEWIVANQLIKILGKKLDEEESAAIMVAIKDHVEYMIQSKETLLFNFDWINKDISNACADDQLAEFLIWFLNHPHQVIQRKTISEIFWILDVSPGIILSHLFTEALSSKNKISEELCSYILHQFSISQPAAVWKYLQSNTAIQNDMIRLSHFSKKMYSFSIATTLKEAVSDAIQFYEKFIATFADGNYVGTDVILDEMPVQSANQTLDQLNSMGILNRKFCTDLTQLIDHLSSPVTRAQQLNVQRYIQRSFFTDEITTKSYELLLMYAINLSLLQPLSKVQAQAIFNIVKQPIDYEIH